MTPTFNPTATLSLQRYYIKPVTSADKELLQEDCLIADASSGNPARVRRAIETTQKRAEEWEISVKASRALAVINLGLGVIGGLGLLFLPWKASLLRIAMLGIPSGLALAGGCIGAVSGLFLAISGKAATVRAKQLAAKIKGLAQNPRAEIPQQTPSRSPSNEPSRKWNGKNHLAVPQSKTKSRTTFQPPTMRKGFFPNRPCNSRQIPRNGRHCCAE